MRLQGSEILKIAIVGPESTGKSTTSKALAEHYDTVWVPEFAREYCEKLSSPCTWQDEINMFRGQLLLEESMLVKANGILICDTTILTVKIWSDHIFGKTPMEVLDHLGVHKYDYYLLMDIDLPWEDDPLRDFPDKREYFMDVWHQELRALGADYTVISGSADVRIHRAIDAIDGFLRKHSVFKK